MKKTMNLKGRMLTYAINSGDAEAAKEVMKMEGDIEKNFIEKWQRLLMHHANHAMWKWDGIQTMLTWKSELNLTDDCIRNCMHYAFLSFLMQFQKSNPIAGNFISKCRTTRQKCMHQIGQAVMVEDAPEWDKIFEQCCFVYDLPKHVRLMIRHRTLFGLTDDLLYETFCEAVDSDLVHMMNIFREELNFDAGTYMACHCKNSSRTLNALGQRSTPIPSFPLTPAEKELMELFTPEHNQVSSEHSVLPDVFVLNGVVFGRRIQVDGKPMIFPVSEKTLRELLSQGLAPPIPEISTYFNVYKMGIPLRFFRCDGTINWSSWSIPHPAIYRVCRSDSGEVEMFKCPNDKYDRSIGTYSDGIVVPLSNPNNHVSIIDFE